MHNAHWHGNTMLHNGHRADQLPLVPGTAVSVDMDVREPGTWLAHCHVNDHIEAGMQFLYHVAADKKVKEAKLDGAVRRYFVAAEEVMWDYAPLGECLSPLCAALNVVFNTVLFTHLCLVFMPLNYINPH
jgi:hephaestin